MRSLKRRKRKRRMSEDNHKQLICWRTHSVTATKHPQMLLRRSDGSTKYPNHWGGEMPPQQNDTGEKQNETALLTP